MITLTPVQRNAYEAAAVDTAIDLLNEIIRIFKNQPVSTPDQQRVRDYNINRAYSALNQLARISYE